MTTLFLHKKIIPKILERDNKIYGMIEFSIRYIGTTKIEKIVYWVYFFNVEMEYTDKDYFFKSSPKVKSKNVL